MERTDRNILQKLRMALLIVLGVSAALGARADAAYDWSAISTIEKIAIVNPFFANTNRQAKPADEQDVNHAQNLLHLNAVLKQTLTNRLKEQKRFQVISDAAVQKALRALHWKASDLFINHGVVAGKQWPKPDTKRLNALAQRLHVDAILLGEMHEPASIGDSAQLRHNPITINPLNMVGIQRIRPHVISPRVQSYLVTLSGTIAWKDEQMADHPRTTPRTAHTLLLDWQEATAQVAGQIVDSLLRMPPPDR